MDDRRPHPHGGQAATLLLTEGAAATWPPRGGPGRPTAGPPITSSTRAPANRPRPPSSRSPWSPLAWRAEAAAKAAFLAGFPDALPLTTRLRAEALVIDQHGIHLTAGLQPPLTPQMRRP